MNNKIPVAVVFLFVGTLISAQSKNSDTILKEQKIDEIIMVGYGTQKKSHLTGSISKVENKTLDQIAVSRVDDALVGQVSGVNVQSTEGEAGSAPTIRIRGTGSISGSSDPLIVVDGLVVDNDYLGSLDMNNVASFEVLKDAASAAIYGSRGGNGVIMITTKQGKSGKTKFSYNTFTGVKKAFHSDAYTFSTAETAAREMAETGKISDRTKYMLLLNTNTNWQDVVFDGGTIENHSISAKGGNQDTKFNFSLGYLHDEGVLITDDYKKYNFTAKVDTKVGKKIKMGFNFSPSYTNRRRFDGSVYDALRQAPWLPVYIDADNIQFVNRLRDNGRYANVKIGDYAWERMFDNYSLVTGMPVATGGTSISDTSNNNPVAKILEKNRTEKKFKVYGSMYGQYDITKNLNFRTVFSADFQNTAARRYQGILSGNIGPSDAQLDLGSENRIHLANDNYLSYSKDFGKSDLSAVLGVSAESWDTVGDETSAAGYTSDILQTLDAGTVFLGKRSYSYKQTLFSYFARVNYGYDNKYLASFSVRRDGSSIFGLDQKYGYFPAGSLGWVLSKEDFLSGNSVLNNLKLRVSYGFTGNKDLKIGGNNGYLTENYPSLSLLSTSSSVVNNTVVNAYNPINIANPFLQWERNAEVNLGFDYGLFRNIISGSVDFYRRDSDQLLLNNPVSGTTGFSNALANLGKVRNSGVELEIRTKNITKQDFRWTSTILASQNINELLNFGDSNGLIQSVDDKRASEWINLIGNPISSFYGWVVDREIPKEYITNPYFPVGGQAQDVYVKDLNGDGLIDDEDKTILGNPYPKLVWSFTNDFEIGNFNVSFMFQGSQGGQVRNIADQYLFNHFNSAQDYIIATTPDQGFIKEKIFTNAIIQDASYISWRNLNIGYNLSKTTLAKLGVINSAKIYATAQNLLYIKAKGYTGFNPESIDNTSATTYGYQRGGSPAFRTVSLGLNLEF
ncbi:SusC/RagA family TonB-linked outer membrane protein [Chryseobacterium salivictor]|uniref:TonB-dependent receptor SusC n=1 Tax=Chryseobacterium salivictor TaxID=2547600 RepID=A0A4V1AL40_9FLAO|nr:SusC/RagA family TonB-linked outer membrane protein [Chryseobacterium salivictor]QBO58434.1 TonB-dependent receptor SusC [Chryseobacterium salivictor]